MGGSVHSERTTFVPVRGSQPAFDSARAVTRGAVPLRRIPGDHVRGQCRTALGTLFGWQCTKQRGARAAGAFESQPSITFVLSGSCLVRTGRHEALVDAAAAALFDAETVYESSHPVAGCDRGGTLLVDPATLDEVLGRPNFQSPFVAVPAATRLRVRWLFFLLEQGPLDVLWAEEQILRILEGLLGDRAAVFRDGGGRHGARAVVEGAREIVHLRLAEKLTLSALAAELGVSPFRLHRAFRELCGQTLHRYAQALRLGGALDRLLAGERDLTGLALDLGFNSHSHFTQTFRDAFGLTPSSLRARAAMRSATR